MHLRESLTYILYTFLSFELSIEEIWNFNYQIALSQYKDNNEKFMKECDQFNKFINCYRMTLMTPMSDTKDNSSARNYLAGL